MGKVKVKNILRKHNVIIKTSGEQHKTFISEEVKNNLLIDYLDNGFSFYDVRKNIKYVRKDYRKYCLKIQEFLNVTAYLYINLYNEQSF